MFQRKEALIGSGPLIFSHSYLAKLIFPLVIEQLLAVTIGMADTVMVASCGEAAVSAISLVDAISQLFIQIFASFATGGAVVASQYLGRKDRPSACIAAKQLVYISTMVAIALVAVGLPFRSPILRFVFGSIEADVMVNAEIYFWIILLSFPFLAIFNACTALFRSMGNSKVSMFVSLVMNIINIGGNAWLIYGMNMGVAGAGYASLASRVVAALIMLVLVRNKKHPIHVQKLFHFEWRWDMIKRILRIGIPSGVENSTFHIGKLLVQSLTATFGTASLAANAITNNICGFMNVPGNAIGLASITVIGQCVGAKNVEQATYYAKRLLLMVYLVIAIICVPLFMFAEPLVGVFNLSQTASVMAVEIIRMCLIVSCFIWPTAFTMPNFLRAAGDAKYTMVVSMFSMWVFRVGCSHLLGQWMGMGLQGVWIAMYIDWGFRSICFCVRFIKGGWKTKRVI